MIIHPKFCISEKREGSLVLVIILPNEAHTKPLSV